MMAVVDDAAKSLECSLESNGGSTWTSGSTFRHLQPLPLTLKKIDELRHHVCEHERQHRLLYARDDNMIAANKGGGSKMPGRNHVDCDTTCVEATPMLTREGSSLIKSSRDKEAMIL
jgi:hypothetical protein